MVDVWQCAVYYNSASGTRNPFMPPDAYPDLENRMDVIGGTAKLTRDAAETVLRETQFYPPAQHAFRCSICGRACDMACYSHLEEKGLLSRKYRTPFRKREDWEFPLTDFEKQG